MEVVEDEELTTEKSTTANVRPTTCTRPPKRPAQIENHARPSDVLRFASNQWGISSYGMFVEATMEEELAMGNSISTNVRLTACTRPPKKLA